MSKWFGFIVVAVSLAALAANATLFWCMEQNKKAIQEIKKLEISLPVDLHKKIDDRLKTAVEKIENDIKTKTDKINSNFQNKFTDLSNNQATLNSQLAQAMQNNINHSNTLTEMLKRESTYLKGQMENSRQKYEASVQDSLREYKKQNTIMLSNMKGIVQKHHSDLAKHFSSLQKSTHAQTVAAFNKLQEDNKREIEKFAKSIDLLARQKIAGNEAAAAEAFKTALEFEKKGDLQSARLYCLNAINHAPNKKQYFDALYRITDSNKKSGITELEQLRSVLELGIYQVDSKDIPSLAKMLANVLTKQEKISAASAKLQNAAEQTRREAALNSLKEGEFSWDTVCGLSPETAIPVLRNRLSKLANLIEQTTGDDADFCKNEVGKTNALLEYSVALFSIDNALKKAENLLKSGQATPAANSMVQSANTLLGQAWNINLDILPEESKNKLSFQAERIVRLEKQFNKIKSRPALAKIKSIYENVDLRGNCTQKINALQDAVKKIMAEAAKVYDTDERSGIEAKIEILSNQVKEYSKERYEGYQKWAVKVCNEVFKKYENEKHVSDDEAESFIGDLKEIDPALLTPSVSRLYQDVLSKQFTELGWEKIAKKESELATSTKKTIEDCPNE